MARSQRKTKRPKLIYTVCLSRCTRQLQQGFRGFSSTDEAVGTMRLGIGLEAVAGYFGLAVVWHQKHAVEYVFCGFVSQHILQVEQEPQEPQPPQQVNRTELCATARATAPPTTNHPPPGTTTLCVQVLAFSINETQSCCPVHRPYAKPVPSGRRCFSLVGSQSSTSTDVQRPSRKSRTSWHPLSAPSFRLGRSFPLCQESGGR